MSDVRILPAMGHGNGNYRVELDGQQIGYVRKRIERYNLRRVITSTNWDAFDLDGFDEATQRRTPGACIARGCATRREAVAALVENYERSLA